MAKKTPTDTHFLTFAVEQSQPEQAGPVRFRGVAYSGGLIPQYGWYGDAAIDLSSVTLPPQIFALVDHATDKRAGKCVPRLEGNQIIVEGELFDATESGREVAALLKAGAPWQMSVGIQAKARSSDEPASVTVNGQTLTVNTVFSDASLREVSFVPVGADPNTAVAAFAKRSGHSQPQGATMELEALKAKVAELEAANVEQKTRAEAAEAKLEEIRMAARKAEVAKLEKDTGQSFDDARRVAFEKMEDAAFAAVVATFAGLAKPAANAPEHLFSEQATGGKAQGGNADTVNLSAASIYSNRSTQKGA
jgi:hypothetical protein